MIKGLFYFSVLLLLGACHRSVTIPQNLHSVKVEVDNVSDGICLSDFFRTSLVKLPHVDTVLVGEIARVHNSGNNIYLSDVSSVFKFSQDGQLIGKISKQGEAPDEYLNVSDFQIDNNGYVWVLCRSARALYLYSWDGCLKKHFSVDLWVENFRLMGDKLYLYTGNEISNDNACQLHVLDTHSGNLLRDFKPVDEHQSSYLFVKGANIFQGSSCDTLCYFSQLFNDTVYRVTPNTFSPAYVFDWGGKNIPSSFYEKRYDNVMDFFQQLHSDNTYAYGINSFAVTDDGTFNVTYFYKGKCYCAVVPALGVDKPLVFNNFTVSCLPKDYKVDLSETSVFSQDDGSLVIPLDMVSLSEKMEDVSEDANPMLLVVSPK